jgi:hypothetical protein
MEKRTFFSYNEIMILQLYQQIATNKQEAQGDQQTAK